MLKYWILLFLVTGLVLAAIFLQDPCNAQFRADFTARYPDYKILDSRGEGDTQSVSCHMFYHKPEDRLIYEDIWTYVNSSDGWKFSEITESRRKEEPSRDSSAEAKEQ